MNGSDCAARVIQVLRRSSLGGSDREIDPREPLGELGLGLDSLALLQFVLALEKEFGTVIPESIWTERGQLTVQDFIEIVAPAAKDAERPGPVPPPTPAALEQGERAGTNAKAFARLRRITSSLFARRKLIVLEFPLQARPLPAYSSPLKLDLRVASEEDAAALCAYWGSSDYVTIDRKEMNMALFRSRLASGDVCLVAWHEGSIVGMDWLFARGFDCPYSGLRMDWPAGTCYGGELSEHHGFTGKGIGMALLAFSLAEARRRGHHRQVATVVAKNFKMLATAVQLYGFVLAGEVHIVRLFGRPFSVWRIGALSGLGGMVML